MKSKAVYSRPWQNTCPNQVQRLKCQQIRSLLPSSPMRPPSTDSWEQEPFIYDSVVGAHTPPLEHRQETPPALRRNTGTKKPPIGTVASGAKAYLQQSLNHGADQDSPLNDYDLHEQRQSDNSATESRLSHSPLPFWRHLRRPRSQSRLSRSSSRANSLVPAPLRTSARRAHQEGRSSCY